jgi:glucose-1-phosphate thymidylyltransferase
MVKDAGFKDVGIIVSQQWGSKIRQHVGDGKQWGMNTSYIVQNKPVGLADAVKTARPYLGDSPFIMILGDNIYGCTMKNIIEEFERCDADALVLLKRVKNPSSFGIAEIDNSGTIIKIQEKPHKPKSNLAVIGIYCFSPLIHEMINSITPSQRGELEITDAIEKLVVAGKMAKGYISDEFWLDTGSIDDYFKANQFALTTLMIEGIYGQVDSTSNLKGKIEIMKGSKVINSLIEGPVSVAHDCTIKKSAIGPYVCIGANTIIENASIKDSIILENCHINGRLNIVNSIVGNSSELAIENSVIYSMITGDNTKIKQFL